MMPESLRSLRDDHAADALHITQESNVMAIPDVFIIESLDPDDEGNGRFEGAIISRILRLHGKNCRYRYVRTRQQFEDAVEEFGNSRYRYLHLSCHGDEESMCTTNLDEIDFEELGEILRPHLAERRVFVSACSMVSRDLARYLIPGSRCNSVIGPAEDVRFTDAAVFWSSMYHLMFTHNDRAMKKKELQLFLGRTAKLFQVKIRYFSKSRSAKDGVSQVLLRKS
jgi:hypothetical protein